jgi:hypothetical protein
VHRDPGLGRGDGDDITEPSIQHWEVDSIEINRTSDNALSHADDFPLAAKIARHSADYSAGSLRKML